MYDHREAIIQINFSVIKHLNDFLTHKKSGLKKQYAGQWWVQAKISIGHQCTNVPMNVLGKGRHSFSEIVSEYDQEIPQSQTADNPISP